MKDEVFTLRRAFKEVDKNSRNYGKSDPNSKETNWPIVSII